MALFNMNNKTFITLIVISTLLFYAMVYIPSIEGKKYHEEFKKTKFDELSIKMHDNFTDEKIEAEITDRNELEFYYNIFANKLEYAQIKERKLYSYSIFFRFYNKKSKKYYIFKVFFDHTKEVERPVFLRVKEEDPGGYGFALSDEDFQFYQKIMEIWEISEKSRI
ncbi:hypothetical protein GM661_03705 [Iocasia frigidifontis]|uniref:Uncharacterized protein n=1 Tax=Iocasia fonsfrigidae TaxID=2682810 RepID=A0A8A7KGZ1_9FIRM|nr:hypothetical protein [Iocasia fonsfrigidae]QTL97142.1 hypothetical protein GM661_03705 [Iocasia fonsfrigidae]